VAPQGNIMTANEIQEIANQNKLGRVWFQVKIAQNTGREIEVGYISLKDGSRDLFCKRQSSSNPDQFYLCNEYAKLTQ
jgi:hypothetical protein